jgi:hypothetical protein
LAGARYRFVYTKGALTSPVFLPFGRMNDLRAQYESAELFPLFQNLLLPENRPEYRHFLEWLNVRDDAADPLALLALTGATRERGCITIFPRPTPRDDGRFYARFFSHGLSHFPESTRVRVASLRPGESLFLMPDPQNPKDRCALALRTEGPSTIVGYCPRYLNRDLLRLLSVLPGNEIDTTVERVNPGAPIQFRLLCSVAATWPEDFVPCSSPEFEPLVADATDQPGPTADARAPLH